MAATNAAIINADPRSVAHFMRTYSAVFHRDRSSDKFHVYYSAPLRKWLRAGKISPTQVKVEFFDTCPCKFGG